MVVCHCHAVNDRSIRTVVRAGARCVESVGRACGAGRACGGCHEAIRDVIEEEHGREPASDAYGRAEGRSAA